MTFSRPSRRSALVFAAILAAALPLAAQQSTIRHRAAAPPTIGPTITLTGVISDATNGQPLANARVTAEGHQSAFTDASGVYHIDISSGHNTAVTAEQFAFNPQTRSVLAQSGATLNFALTPKPVVTVKLTSPQGNPAKDTYVLDIDSAKFAYLIPFSGYVSGDLGNFCKDDGTTITPDKKDIRRVIGPAVQVDKASCCKFPIYKATLELKTGETFPVYFNDSCLGNEVDFLGREKSTGVFQYFRFSDITEVDFP
jgi:hypothetical protein